MPGGPGGDAAEGGRCSSGAEGVASEGGKMLPRGWGKMLRGAGEDAAGVRGRCFGGKMLREVGVGWVSSIPAQCVKTRGAPTARVEVGEVRLAAVE